MPPSPPPSTDLRRDAWLLFPLLAAIAFVGIFARALPLTDEWFYVHILRQLHDVDLASFSGIAEAIRLYPVKFNEHLVGFPFVFYWPLAELTNFDSRWAIALTVAAFAGQAWLFRRYLVPSAWWAMPVVLLLFCPSHYMEFMWGWQITLSFSVVFPLAALVLLDRITDVARGRAQARRFALAVLCLLLGTFSSAGALFGFISGFVLLLTKPLDRRSKVAFLAVLTVVAPLVYLCFMRGSAHILPFGGREVWYVLTALGGTLFGTPVGLTQFGFDFRSAAGLAIVACTVAVVVRACVLRLLPQLALALCVTLFGYLCVVPIAMSRPYLGNWHLQYALPAVSGAYAAAFALWKRDRSLFGAVPFFGLCVLLTSCLFGYFKGFADYGPGYLNYVRSIEEHVVRNLVEPGRPTPYPPQGDRDMTARLALFLSAHDHPLFADSPAPVSVAPLPPGARVFLDGVEISMPWRFSGGQRSTALLTVVLPNNASTRGVLVRVGESSLILHRVHPQHVPAEVPREPDPLHFMGMVLPHRLPEDGQPVKFSVFE